MNNTWRDKCTLDVKAKLMIDRGQPYVPGGIPWLYEMGSGGYWAKLMDSGLTDDELERLAKEPLRFGKVVDESTPYVDSNRL